MSTSRDMASIRTAYLARSVPASARGTIQRAFDGTASPRAAIRAQCLACSNFQRDEITACTVVLCALWSYRPFQSARKPSKTARGSEISGGSCAAGSSGGADATA
jgi:hypothetical protein